MEDKKLRPGDEGYKGGIFRTRIYTEAGDKEIVVVKDEDGNIISGYETKLFLGLF